MLREAIGRILWIDLLVASIVAFMRQHSDSAPYFSRPRRGRSREESPTWAECELPRV
jgi:hypothetical protein